jgi:predicted GNAT family acetyltransferase
MADPDLAAPDLTIADHAAENRYEAHLGDELAGFLEYRLAGARRILIHTEVLPSFAGRGIGAALARHVLDEALATGARVTPKCPFVRAWLERHPEYVSIVTPKSPRREGA